MTRAKAKKFSVDIVTGLEPKKRRQSVAKDYPPAKKIKIEKKIEVAPHKIRSPQPTPNNIVAKPIFNVGEIIWAKIKGHACWPAKIVMVTSKRALVYWLNDYRTTNVYLTQLYKFLPHFDEFSKKFSHTVGLECAAKEALILYGQQLYSKKS